MIGFGVCWGGDFQNALYELMNSTCTGTESFEGRLIQGLNGTCQSRDVIKGPELVRLLGKNAERCIPAANLQ